MVLLFALVQISTPSPPLCSFPFHSLPFPSPFRSCIPCKVSLFTEFTTEKFTNTRHNELDHASQRRNAYKM